MFKIIAFLCAALTAFPAFSADIRAAKVTPSHALTMHGDPLYEAGFKHFSYVNPDAPKGGTARLWAQGGFDSLNPFIVKGSGAAGLGRIYDSLMVSSADEPFTQYGLLAKTVEAPKDRSWVVFNLRKEARWHDGKPVTADDVVFTFNTLLKEGRPHYRFYYAGIDKVIKESSHRVRFTFKPGRNRELPLILGQIPILPKHYWKGREFGKTTLEPPLGSGPYRIKELEAGRAITYERVAEYWGKDLPVNVGRNNFGAIRIDYYRDSLVALEAFKAGAYDIRIESSSKDWAVSYDIPAVRVGLIKQEEVSHRRVAGMQGFVYNTRRPLFKDRKVRRALTYAFDFEWTNKNLFHGQYTRTRSYFDNSELAATSLPGKQERKLLFQFKGRIPNEAILNNYTLPVTDGMGRIRKNLRKADQMLKEAGWTIENGKRVNASGQPFEFEILLLSPLFERVSLPFAKNLERLGIKARVRTVDSAQYQYRLENFDFDMTVAVFGQSPSPGNEQRNYWGSAAADQKGSRNLIGIKEPVIDELIELLVAAPDRNALVIRTRALDRVLLWGHYIIPHWHIPYDRLAYWDKFGMPQHVPMQGYQFDTWWVDPQKVDALNSKRTPEKE